MQTIISIFSIILFLYVFYFLFFESRYSWISYETFYDKNIPYTMIWYKDKNKPGLQEERIDGVSFNRTMIDAHISSKNVYYRRSRIKFLNYKD